MKLSFVIPIYNDGYLAEALCKEVQSVFSKYLSLKDLYEEVEVIFINDGSRDNSTVLLQSVADQFKFVRIIDLSRNFGQHIAIACGLREARGDVIIRMNVDMQDHPRDLPVMLSAMHASNSDLVVGVYETRQSPAFERFTSWLYFVFFRALTGLPAPQNTSPMRAMSRKFVDAYNLLTERTRFPQGLDQWLGFNHLTVPIMHHKRLDGRSSYNFWSRTRLALEGMIYFSDRPLNFILSFGFLCAIVGFLLGAGVVISKLLVTEFLPGYVSLLSVALLAFGVQIGALGVIGLYIARIFRETQNRPLYLIKGRYPAKRSINGAE